MALLHQSFEEEKYICQYRLTDWDAKVRELTEYERPALHGIKLPKHCLKKEIFLFKLLWAIVTLREDMISDMELMHNTYGMLYILKAAVMEKQTKKREQLKLLARLKKIMLLLLKEIIFQS